MVSKTNLSAFTHMTNMKFTYISVTSQNLISDKIHKILLLSSFYSNVCGLCICMCLLIISTICMCMYVYVCVLFASSFLYFSSHDNCIVYALMYIFISLVILLINYRNMVVIRISNITQELEELKEILIVLYCIVLYYEALAMLKAD